MIPDVSEALDGWEQLLKLKAVTVSTIDFVERWEAVVMDLLAVPQPTDMETLQPSTIDWSKEYITFHTKVLVQVGNYIEYKGKDYKIVKGGDWTDGGFSEVVGEETKSRLIIAPPSNTVAPVITGTFEVGEELSVDTGTWLRADTYTYQWYRDGDAIADATANTYTLVDDDLGLTVDCIVTAKNFFSFTAAQADGDIVA